VLSIGSALIVLDEATEGLAPLIVADIWLVIGEIRASGIASLIVDRDYRKVLGQADKVAKVAARHQSATASAYAR